MANHDFNRPYPHVLRLRGYDYARAGTYFVTIWTEDRTCLFGEGVTDGDVQLNDPGPDGRCRMERLAHQVFSR